MEKSGQNSFRVSIAFLMHVSAHFPKCGCDAVVYEGAIFPHCLLQPRHARTLGCFQVFHS